MALPTNRPTRPAVRTRIARFPHKLRLRRLPKRLGGQVAGQPKELAQAERLVYGKERCQQRRGLIKAGRVRPLSTPTAIRTRGMMRDNVCRAEAP